ncbi:hypothetical protein K6U06_06680 [Acidiferrimicrobium sp. IK]|uniref:hypothetical protein n=1 Tax=Acidiferrimicrobium sp. IK TaxID=2871700 RepID=UPI0021CB942D|nr:hypothetical protein [Acidiferrimicrobium sp. IK]MCU4184039.1 hypothetical protein [Acidiferrimicrobium sp. IK]
MNRGMMGVALAGVLVVAAACGGSTSASPTAATKRVCTDVAKLQAQGSSSSPNSQAILDANGDMLSAVVPLNAGGSATATEQQIGQDALTAAKQVNDVTSGGGSPAQLGLQLTKLSGECSAEGD